MDKVEVIEDITEEESIVLDEYKKIANSAESVSELERGLKKLKEEPIYSELKESKENIHLDNSNEENNKRLPITSIEEYENKIKAEKEGLHTGIKALEENGILIPSKAVTLIAGRPGHGKTAVMLNMLINQVQKYPDKTFYFFSYELPKEHILIRILNIMCQTTFSDNEEDRGNNNIYIKNWIKMDKLPKENPLTLNYEKIEDYIAKGRLRIFDNRDMDSGTLKEKILLEDEEKIGAVYLDYIQVIKSRDKDKKSFDKKDDISRVCDDILNLAIGTGASIICGAQLNRDSKNEDSIYLHHLKDCGVLEQFCDLCIGLFNHADTFDKEESCSRFDFKILKNRYGGIGESTSSKTLFHGPSNHIRDLITDGTTIINKEPENGKTTSNLSIEEMNAAIKAAK